MPPTTKHSDSRGFFQELYHFNHDDLDYAQVSWFSLEPGKIRGKHYHHRTSEMFIVLEGQVDVELKERCFNTVKHHRLEAGEQIKVGPGWIHSFLSVKGAKILAFSTRHFNPNDSDTYTE